MWLDDGNQHSFPVKSLEDNYIPSANVWLDKDIEYEVINNKNDDKKEKDIFSSLNYKVTKMLLSPYRKFRCYDLEETFSILVYMSDAVLSPLLINSVTN